MHVVQVVGSLPPETGGVGDYACRLAEAMSGQTGNTLDTSYVACGHVRQRSIEVARAVNLTAQCSAASLVDAVVKAHPTAVLVNYVGYSFAKRGAPLWLLDAMAQLRARAPEIALHTMFHELYATGMPWRSSFWTSPVQRHIACGLAKASVSVAATTRTAAAWLNLRRRAFRQPAAVLPVCSNVGEPATLRAFDDRAHVAVLFNGGGPFREALLRSSGSLLRKLRACGIDSLVQFGARAGPFTSAHGVTCTNTGPMPSGEISRHLTGARIAIASYPFPYVTKSGVVAAYLAHGVPVLLVEESMQCRLLRPGGPQSAPGSLDALQLDLSELERASAEGYEWYRAHAHSSVHAAHWLREMRGDPR